MKMPVASMTPTEQVVAVCLGAVGLSIATVFSLWVYSRRGLLWEGTRVPVSRTSMTVGLVSGWLGFYTILGFLPLWFFLPVGASIPAGIVCYLRDKRLAAGKDEPRK
jgi:hypothetical protein